ncbi:hypothetical protein [Candidatus Magnetomonas plexicatena]|uniref:hypothetical protein n=1 Tax=Candidatus Magnetomonas plexicatena TaxID=2552947 RepID=UPI001C78A0BE|nr:hypothetical protein E2O03_012540 [Nitrospirales bacterium LBB_01]
MHSKIKEILKKPDTALYIAIGVYFVITLINLLNHVMWRDELGPWAIAHDSSSLSELFYNYRYEGHPRLWVLIVYLLTKLNNNMAAMQMVHLCFATATAFVLLKFSPFKKWQRIFLIFGYFTFYEYAVISRNYSMGVLLFFIIAYMMRPAEGRRNYILLSVVLFIMCQTNAYAAVVAIAFALTLCFEFIMYKQKGTNTWLIFVLSAFIFISGLIFSIYQMVPPPDSQYLKKPEFLTGDPLNDFMRILAQISIIYNVYFPIPMFRDAFWGGNIIGYISENVYVLFFSRVVVGTIFLFITFFMVIRRPVAAFFFIAGNAALMAFSDVVYGSLIRHRGHLFMVFICSMWLSYYYKPVSFKSDFLNRFCQFFEEKRSAWLNFFIAIHLFTAITAITISAIYPFTDAKDTADFIKANKLDLLPIAADLDYQTTSVAVYLGKSLFYPITERYGMYVISNNKRLYIDKDGVLKEIEKFMKFNKRNVLLVLNYQLSTQQIEQNNIVHIRTFANGIVGDERYCLYVMKYNEVNP